MVVRFPFHFSLSLISFPSVGLARAPGSVPCMSRVSCAVAQPSPFLSELLTKCCITLWVDCEKEPRDWIEKERSRFIPLVGWVG
jgi:hypothetical protein